MAGQSARRSAGEELRRDDDVGTKRDSTATCSRRQVPEDHRALEDCLLHDDPAQIPQVRRGHLTVTRKFAAMYGPEARDMHAKLLLCFKRQRMRCPRAGRPAGRRRPRARRTCRARRSGSRGDPGGDPEPGERAAADGLRAAFQTEPTSIGRLSNVRARAKSDRSISDAPRHRSRVGLSVRVGASHPAGDVCRIDRWPPTPRTAREECQAPAAATRPARERDKRELVQKMCVQRGCGG